VKVNELPKSLQSALSSNGYHKPDIEVIAKETTSLNPGTAFEGNRGFTCAVNLESGHSGYYQSLQGSWGGANSFEHTIDHDDTQMPIESNMALIKGENGGRGSFARIYVAPGTLAKFLPAPKAELTEAQGVVLHCLKAYKSSYRRDEARRYGVKAGTWDATLVELAGLGYAKISKNGASQITTEGKNALVGFKLPKANHF